jgi:arylsulfatase A-like enzyme
LHVTDWFTTILHAAGVDEPTDRVIDGVDQLDWIAGKQESSAREGNVHWMGHPEGRLNFFGISELRNAEY